MSRPGDMDRLSEEAVLGLPLLHQGLCAANAPWWRRVAVDAESSVALVACAIASPAKGKADLFVEGGGALAHPTSLIDKPAPVFFALWKRCCSGCHISSPAVPRVGCSGAIVGHGRTARSENTETHTHTHSLHTTCRNGPRPNKTHGIQQETTQPRAAPKLTLRVQKPRCCRNHCGSSVRKP